MLDLGCEAPLADVPEGSYGLTFPSFSLDDICPDPCLNEDSLESVGYFQSCLPNS